MNQQSLSAGPGIVACLGAIATLVAPYLFVPDVASVGVYYALGAITPLSIGLIALVGVVAFASGVAERTDPELIAGLMLVAGVVALVIALLWALSFGSLQHDLVSATVRDQLAIHRWTVLAASTLWAVAAIWYTWSLGLLSTR